MLPTSFLKAPVAQITRRLKLIEAIRSQHCCTCNGRKTESSLFGCTWVNSISASRGFNNKETTRLHIHQRSWAPVASSCRRLAHLQMHVLLTPPCKFDFPILNLDQLWKLLWNHLETTLILTSPGTPRAKKTIYLKRVASIWGWLPTWLSCMAPIHATRRGLCRYFALT